MSKRLLYLLSIVLLFFSFGAEAQKIVVCVSSDAPVTEPEGFARKMASSLSLSVDIYPGVNLSDCLDHVVDGDFLLIVAHGLPGVFQWNGQIYDGFDGDQYQQGQNKITLPNNFNQLQGVQIFLSICDSATDPDGNGSNFSIAEKLLQAMGGQNIQKIDKGVFADHKKNIVGASEGDSASSVKIKLTGLTPEQEKIEPAINKIIKLNDFTMTDNSSQLNAMLQQVKSSLGPGTNFPDIDPDDPLVTLWIKIKLSQEWHTHPPVNRPNSEDDNHQTAIQAIVDASEVANKDQIVAEVLEETYYIHRHIPPCEELEQQHDWTEESCGIDCESEYCGEYCGNVFVTIITRGEDETSSLYCVHDDDRNDSQFCYGVPLPIPSIAALGPRYENCDIEALDIQHKTDHLYAASGDDTPRKGHLYYVSKADGDIIDLGKISCCDEVDAISFHPTRGDLWGWAQDVGLFVINPFPYPDLRWFFFPPDPPFPPGIPILPEVNIKHPKCLPPKSPVPTIPASVILSKPAEIEDITWNWMGTVLYAVENVHTHPDPDSHGDVEDLWPSPDFDFDFEEGIKLWAYDSTSGVLKEICQNLAPSIAAILGKKAEIEALESLPNDIWEPPVPDNQDLLVVGFHGPFQLRYAVIETPPLPLSLQTECKIVWKDAIPSSFNDIEGIAYSPNPKP